MENEMIGKLVGRNYKIIERFAGTKFSDLYKAVYVNADGKEDKLIYLIKAHKKDSVHERVTLKNEKITQDIANYAKKSIVLPVLHIYYHDGYEYVVMKFEQSGKFLSDLIVEYEKKYEGRIPYNIQLDIVLEILDSLSILHNFNQKEKIVHTDLHPGNIFFENADADREIIGTAKFIDFTNAIIYSEGDEDIKRDYISITPGFSAPEQRNMNVKLQPAADLYAVAAIASRMYTGKIISNIQKNYMDILSEKWCENVSNHALEYMFKKFFEYGLSDNITYRYKSADEMTSVLKNIKKCVEAENDNNYYEIFHMAYNMFIPKADVNVELFKYDEDKFKKSVDRLEKDLLQSLINVNQCDYIFQLLWKMCEYFSNQIPESVKNSLIHSGIACCNHTGNSFKGIELYHKLNKNEMPLVKYFSAINRAAVMFQDTYQYSEAYDLMKKNVERLEIIKEMYKKVAELSQIEGDKPIQLLELGRAYSAIAGYMALLDKDESSIKEMYKKALDEFGEDKDNRGITQCHMMNYAVMIGDEEYYWNTAKEYFDYDVKKDFPMESLKKLVNKDTLNRFSLHILLKGIYTFYMEQINLEFVEMLQYLMIDRRLKKLSEHPVQLVYKYIGLIIYEYNRKANHHSVNSVWIDKAFFHAIQCIPQGKINLHKELNILMCITYQIMWIYSEIADKSNSEDQRELLNIMLEHSKKSGWDGLYEELQKRQSGKNIFDFEYC